MESGRTIRLRAGLDLPIPGEPPRAVAELATPSAVAILADDYRGLRLVPEVRVGQAVRTGQPVLRDSARSGIRIPSPAAGSVVAMHRDGSRLLAVEIEVGDEASLGLPRVGLSGIRALGRDGVTRHLVEAGDWTALRERPFGRLAEPGGAPAAIFVRAMDSNPLAVDARQILSERAEDLRFGLTALRELTDGPVYVCGRPGSVDGVGDVDGVEFVGFEGPHPAGLVGTHIHHLRPVSDVRSVWHAGYQDVVAIGQLFRTGRPDPVRTISVSGPGVADPRLVRTRLGAGTDALVGRLAVAAPCRVISGSVLSGRVVSRPTAFLGRYHEQVCVLPERSPVPDHGVWPWRKRRRRWSAELHGSPRPFLPLEVFERVFPLSVPIGPLLRVLAARDARSAIALGALELEEEDLALCAVHCPAKIEYGSLLREVLDESMEARA